MHRWHARRYMSVFLKRCPSPFRGEVLEVGAGRGYTTRRILEAYPQVELTAVDADARATTSFEDLRSDYGQRLKVREADIKQLPFDRASFDIVIAAHVLHYVDDVPRAIREMLRVVRPGGLIGVTGDNQKYVVGPLKRLWRAASRVDRPVLEKVFSDEGGKVVVSKGHIHFLMWVEKPYPIEGGE